MKGRLLGILQIFITVSVHASDYTINWTGSPEYLNIADQVFILEDVNNQYSIDMVASPELDQKFVRSGKKVLNFSNSSYYWLKFTLFNDTSEPLMLVIDQPVLAQVELYYEDTTSGKWEAIHAGFNVPLDQKAFKHPFQIFLLPAIGQEYYVKLQPFALAVPVQIWNANKYEFKINNHRIIFGVFTGMMLFVIVTNLFFFVTLHRPANIHYALLVFLYYLIASNVEGYILYWFPRADLVYGINIYAIFTMPVGLSYVLFFLEANRYMPRLNRVGWGIVIFYCSFIIWHVFLTPLQLYYVTDVMGLSTVVIMLVMGFLTGRKGNKMGYYFFVAYMLFFLIAIIDSVNRFSGIPPDIFEISYISIAFMVEAFALSFLLSKRFQWEKEDDHREKELAQLSLIEQTKENERIVREQNVILEELVQGRTSQLKEANEELTTLLETVDEERKKSESLILNILPATTARELKELGNAKPQTYQLVSVLFTDFKDFTKVTANMSPEKLVNDLNECFSQFDKIIQKYGIEKIKTIGDSYMAAGGLPVPSGLHALDTVRAGLAMRDYMETWNARRINSNHPPFLIRIGIHSGPVVAGVVGTHKFAYDIWGDTVNIASRLESNGEPGKVNVSAITMELVKDNFQFTPRGLIEVKGKGALDMYWVEHKSRS